MFDISPENLQIVKSILQKHVPQFEVWAFGSRVSTKAKKYSDLDLVIICQEPLPLSVYSALCEEFSESDLPWKVDIVDWSSTQENFRKLILQKYIIIQEGKLN
jgi:predicted nucleotidyltransferase